MSGVRAMRAILAGAVACAAALAVAPAAAARAAALTAAAPSQRSGQGRGGVGRGGAAGAPPAVPAQAPPATPAPAEIGVWWSEGAVAPGAQAPPSLRRDRPLTAGEARQLQRLRQAARRWRAALAPLAAAARSQGDGALQADLVRLDVILWQLAWAQQLTLASYAAALRASNDALTLWRTDAAYVGTGEQAWQEAGAGASELTTAADTGFVFGVDLGSGQTWSYAEGGTAGQGAAGEGDGGEGAAVDQGAPGDGAPGQGAAGEGAAGPAAGAAAATGAAGADHDIAMPEDAPEVGEIGDAALPAAGVAAEVSPVPGSGWIVIHGGAGAGLPAEALPVSAEPASPEADSAAALDDTAPLAWEEICRPWQPSAGGVAGLCVMSPSA